jgi:CRP-like cAMP-binding protein
MEQLIAYLLKFGHLNEQQIELIKRKAKEVNLKKDAYFAQAGEIANKAAIVVEGILRIYYYNHKGEQFTRYFIDEEHFVADLNSFNYKIPTAEYAQAVVNCRLIVFTSEDFAELSATIVGWDAIMAKIISKGLMEKVKRISSMLGEDGKTRYQNFLEKFPNMINRIPLALVASYLGMTQSSLSRIRKAK